MPIRFERTVPIFRIFSQEKAKEFYLGFLGFHLDWEHRFDPDAPVYMQVSRAGMTLHLSERHGDGAPGATLFVETAGLDALHAEGAAKNYRYLRPGIEDAPWGARVMPVADPFSNRIRFGQ